MKRRMLLLGSGAVLATAAGGVAAWKLHLFGPHYPPTPYDDVLNRLSDREWASKFGAQALSTLPDFTPEKAAARLRGLLGNGTLEVAALRDAEAGRVTEAAKWLVPESVALIAALSASAK
jgi:hypothetical protein